jgi:hypothetical protein
MRWLGRVDELLARCRALAVLIDRDDLEVLALQFLAQFLPDRQVKAAASPR